MGTGREKSMKRMNRRWENIPADIIKRLAEGTVPQDYASDWMSDTRTFEYADAVAGKKLRIVSEEACFEYDFETKTSLLFSGCGACSVSCFYRALPEPGHPELIFVQHYLDGLTPAQCVNTVLDLETGYAVVITARIGEIEQYPREVSHKIFIGEIEGYLHPEGSEKPCFTQELVGRAVLWDMPGFTDKPPIKHIYLSPEYYAIHMTRPDGSCFMSADPADYIRIKEGVCLVSIIEERRSGIQLSFLINTDILQDIVGHFGISAGNEIGQDEPRIVCTVMTGRKGKWVPMETF